MSLKQKKDETKQSMAQVWANNWFLIKLCLTASPSYVIFAVLDSMRNQISIFFEHTYGIGYVLEAAEFHYPFWEVARFLLILAGAITLGMVFTVFVGDFIMEKERPKVRERIKMMLYQKAKDLDLECYDNPEYYNEMVLAISEVDKQIDRCVTFLQNTASGITVFVSTGFYFLWKDKFSILFVVVSFVMSFCFNQLYNKLSYKIRIARNPHERKREYIKRVFYLSDYAKELRLNPKVADVLFERFEQANEEVYQVERKQANKRFFLSYMRRHVSNNIFSDVIYTTYLVFKATVLKSLSFSSVAILFNSFGRLKQGMRVFTDVYPFACETSLYVQKIRNFLEYKPKIVNTKALPVESQAKEISVEGMSFAYNEKDGELLKDINLHIAPGSKIAVVGYNGAGKTTLVKLLMRLYDVKSGVIKADGVDIRDYDVLKYRESIGTVFQDFQIFAGTVRENIYMDVVPQKQEEEALRQALKDSGLLSRIDSMEDGLETQLTTEIMDKGVNLSGGEAQKLAIARVFHKKAGLMILDEPSSALDPIAEYQLNHAMLSACKDKTVIFISHRLSTTRLADHIIMLEQGRIVERGTHEQLLALDGKYARMWKVQAGAYTL